MMIALAYPIRSGILAGLGAVLVLGCSGGRIEPVPQSEHSGSSGKALYDRALRHRSKTSTARKLSAQEYFDRGDTYDRQGNHNKAIEAYGKAIAANPRLVAAYYRRARAYQRKGLHAAAILDFEQVLAASPNSAQALYFRGVAHARLERHEQAIKDLSRVISLSDENPRAYYQRGQSYYAIEEFTRALKDFDKTLALEPDHGPGYFYRGLTYYSLGKYNRAIMDYTRALLYKPASVPSHVNRCWALALLGRAEQAREDCGKAALMNPRIPNVYDALGFVFWQLGDRNKALISLSRARALDDEYPAPDERYAEFPIMLAQSLLKVSGYDPGVVDGEMGELTRNAIRKFQRDQKLRVTGEVSEELLDRLRKTPAARYLHEAGTVSVKEQ